MKLHQHRFVLRAIDPALGCPVLEAMLHVADLETLRPLLGVDTSDDAELETTYLLDPVEVQAIMQQFGVAFDPDGRECSVSRPHWIDDAPYLTHSRFAHESYTASAGSQARHTTLRKSIHITFY